jgi:hypothetical protein
VAPTYVMIGVDLQERLLIALREMVRSLSIEASPGAKLAVLALTRMV